MRDDPRPCRRADGMGKIGYSSKAVAKRALARWRTKDGKNDRGIMDVYRCPVEDCRRWHIGTNREKQRKREERRAKEAE